MNHFKRTVRKFVSGLVEKNQVLFFIVLFLICIIAICVGIYVQYFYEDYDTDPLMLGIHVGNNKMYEEYTDLKNNFNDLFTNEVYVSNEKLNVDKINTTQNIVYTYNNVENKDENFYDVNVNIPAININNDIVKEINSEMIDKFDKRSKDIMTKADDYTIYYVDYVAFVNSGIVSVVIREKSRTNETGETITISTYNYSISEKRKISFDDLIKLKKTNKKIIQETINASIKASAEKNNEIAKEYGGLIRKPEDKMYRLENVENYFLTNDGYVYIIYDYADKNTNEIDIVIF